VVPFDKNLLTTVLQLEQEQAHIDWRKLGLIDIEY
jgi:hypothetical protein